MNRYESVVFALLVFAAVMYAVWPFVRPKVVSMVVRLRSQEVEPEVEQGEWLVIELDPVLPRDQSRWPRWQPTPKGRWE